MQHIQKQYQKLSFTNKYNWKEINCPSGKDDWNSRIKSSIIGAHPERLSKINLFTNKYNWKVTNYPSGKDDWKTFEKLNIYSECVI